MKLILTPLLFASALTAPVWAQPAAGDHSGHHATAAVAATAPALEMTEGEIRKVDKTAARITIKHGEIANLGMPPMTMVFAVRDKAMLDRVKAGDKVRFRALDDAGRLTLSAIEAESSASR